MPDLAFYEAGCHELRGPRRVVVPARRLLRRLLRPIFLRQAEWFQHLSHRLDAAELADRALRADLDALTHRHDHLADEHQTTAAFGWDYVALTRRLAALEDQVARLTDDGSRPGESKAGEG